MKEYIEREAAIKAIENDCLELVYYTKEDAIQCVKAIPAADVAEVWHGRWERVIPTKSAAKWSTKVSCSNCHSVGYMRYNYCPNCGALMDKEEK